MLDSLPENVLWKTVFVVVLSYFMEPHPIGVLLTIFWAFQPEAWHGFYDYVGAGKEDWDHFDFVWVFAVAMWAVFVVIYWGNGLFMMWLDCNFTTFMDKFRMQPDKKQNGNAHLVDEEMNIRRGNVLRMIKLVGVNTALMPFMLAPFGYFLQYCTPFTLKISREIPDAQEMLWQIMINVVVFLEFFHYHIHAYMHYNKWLYRNVHKVHHEYTSPNALTSAYCHPFEFFANNLFPWSIGFFVMHAHVYTMLAFVSIAIINLQTAHCGFQLPWNYQYHDLHHQYYNCNYGISGFFDWLNGTLVNGKMAYLFRVAEKKGVVSTGQIITKLANGGRVEIGKKGN